MKGKKERAYIDLSQLSKTFRNLLACSRLFRQLVIVSFNKMSIYNTLKFLVVSKTLWNLLEPFEKFQNILDLVLTK